MAFILIVDRDESCAEQASTALISAGHACGWAASAGQAAEMLRWRPADLILLDADMPGTGGGPLYRELRGSRSAREVPMILLSASGHSGIMQPCGALDDIAKPFDPRFLAWRVNHALEVQAARPARRRRRAWIGDMFEDERRRNFA